MSNGESWASPNERARLKAVTIARWGTDCYLCGEPITIMSGKQPMSYSLDHVIPRSAGGSVTDPENLRSCHLACNVRKGNKPLSTYNDLHENALDWALSLK